MPVKKTTDQLLADARAEVEELRFSLDNAGDAAEEAAFTKWLAAAEGTVAELERASAIVVEEHTITFTAKVSRDTTPRGAKRRRFVGSSARGFVVESRDEQLFLLDIDPVVTEELELVAYPDSGSCANIFAGDEIIASITNSAACDLDIVLYSAVTHVEIPEALVLELRERAYRSQVGEISRAARRHGEDVDAALAELRAECGL